MTPKTKRHLPADKHLTKSFAASPLLKALPPGLKAIDKEDGFWMYATREIVDSDGDIVFVDGINMDAYHRPADGVHLKVLAGHLRCCADGTAPVVGVVTDFAKVVVPFNDKMVKALALCVSYLKDADGKRLPLSQHYFDMLNAEPAPGIDSGSVGILVDDYEEVDDPARPWGLDITRCTIFEFSLTATPANCAANLVKSLREKGFEVLADVPASDNATGITEGAIAAAVTAAMAPIIERLVKVETEVSERCTRIDKSLGEIGTALANCLQRLDTLESALVVLTQSPASGEDDAKHAKPDNGELKAIAEALDSLRRTILP